MLEPRRDRRAGNIGLDGSGIVLWIEWTDGSGIGGTWQPAGIVAGDSGTWSATRASR